MNDQYIDRITEAYLGQMGCKMQKNSAKRIDWICAQTEGKTILDIGCSQGICSILLGRAEKIVTGIDVVKESVLYAQSMLRNEEDAVRQRVHFLCDDFLSYEFHEKSFDTIIIGEVLEHLEAPLSFLEKASRLLKEQGKVIVTVPFGISLHPDHKRTYYFLEIYHQVSNYFTVKDVHFMGAWIGIVGVTYIEGSKWPMDEEFIKQLENAFYVLDSEKTDSKKKANEALFKCNDKYRALCAAHAKIKEQYKELALKSQEKAEKREEQYAQLAEKFQNGNDRYKALCQTCAKLKEQNQKLQAGFKESCEKYRALCLAHAKDKQKYQTLAAEYASFEKQHSELAERMESYSRTKLFRLMLWTRQTSLRAKSVLLRWRERTGKTRKMEK